MERQKPIKWGWYLLAAGSTWKSICCSSHFSFMWGLIWIFASPKIEDKSEWSSSFTVNPNSLISFFSRFNSFSNWLHFSILSRVIIIRLSFLHAERGALLFAAWLLCLSGINTWHVCSFIKDLQERQKLSSSCSMKILQLLFLLTVWEI